MALLVLWASTVAFLYKNRGGVGAAGRIRYTEVKGKHHMVTPQSWDKYQITQSPSALPGRTWWGSIKVCQPILVGCNCWIEEMCESCLHQCQESDTDQPPGTEAEKSLHCQTNPLLRTVMVLLDIKGLLLLVRSMVQSKLTHYTWAWKRTLSVVVSTLNRHLVCLKRLSLLLPNLVQYLTGLLVRDTRNESRQANRRSSITPDFSSPRNSWGDIWWRLLKLPYKKRKGE